MCELKENGLHKLKVEDIEQSEVMLVMSECSDFQTVPKYFLMLLYMWPFYNKFGLYYKVPTAN